MNYPAPALERGVKVLNLLSSKEALSLEEIAARLNAPKSSLLRILETLCQINLVYKDISSKKYTALSVIIPVTSEEGLTRQNITDSLENLTRQTLLTAEWYVFDSESMVMTERKESKDSPVYIIARIGWKRGLADEFEAVTRIALAYGCQVQKQSGKSHWSYDSKGEKYILDENEITTGIELVLEDKCTVDQNYNSQGVRRYAAPVLGENGALYGVLSLAENFTPSANKKSAEKLDLIKKEAEKLTHILNQRIKNENIIS